MKIIQMKLANPSRYEQSLLMKVFKNLKRLWTCMKTWQKGVCIGAAVGVAAPFAIVGGLAVAGFGAGGVVAGSAAAGAQAAIGNVAAGSLFASKSK